MTLFDLPEPTIAPASREAFDKILPTLSQREIEVFLSLCDFLKATGYEDCTGGELAAWSGKLVTSIRPRLTGLREKGWIESWSMRSSRARYEGRCHPFRPCVPRSAVERARRSSA